MKVNKVDNVKAKKNMRYARECFNNFQQNNIAIFDGKLENALYFFKNWEVVYYENLDITIVHLIKDIEEKIKNIYPQDKFFKDEEFLEMGFSKAYKTMEKTYTIDNVIIDVLFYIDNWKIKYRIKRLNYKNIIENIENNY